MMTSVLREKITLILLAICGLHGLCAQAHANDLLNQATEAAAELARDQFLGFEEERKLTREEQKLLRLSGRIALQAEWLGHNHRAQAAMSAQAQAVPYTREDALRRRRELTVEIDPLDQGFRRKAAGISTQRWQSIGPRNIGARTRAIAQHPHQPNTLYLGAASGGIWKTVNGGATWTNIADTLTSPEIADIHIDPITPNRVWVATGELVYGARGGGIYVSEDAGNTWTQRSSTSPSTHGGFRWMGRLVINPVNTSQQWLAASGGIYRTNDGWNTAIRAWPTSTYTGNWIAEGFTDIEIDPNNPNHMLAGGLRGQVARSTNGGASWSEIQVVPWSSGYSRVEVAYAKNAPGRVYASTIGGSGGRFFVSADGGVNWTERTQPQADVVDPYKNTVWVDPLNADHVIVGGTTLRRSLNAGMTWSQFNSASESAGTGGTVPIIHVDHHILITDVNYSAANRRVFAGTDGGVYVLDDVTVSMPGTTGAPMANGWRPINAGQSVNQLYAVSATSVTTPRAASGSQDQSVAITSTTSLTPNLTQQSLGGDVMAVAVDPDSSFTYYLYQFMEPARISGLSYTGGEFRICQQMKLPSNQHEGVCAGSGLFQARFRSPMVFDNIGTGGRLLVGGNHLWRSTNPREPVHANVVWTRIKAPSATSGNYITAIATRATNPDLIWVAHDNGELYRTTNGTAASPTWTAITGPTARGNTSSPTSLYLDPNSDNVVYVTFPWFGWQNIWRSTNATAAMPTWSAVGSGVLPLAPVYAVTKHPTNNWLYVATEVGVFVSENGGTTWSTTDDGPRSAPVTTFSWTGGPVLFASTYGRGAWQLDLSDDYANTTAAANLFASTSTTPAAIEMPGDVDVFKFRFPSAGTWTIGTTGSLDTLGSIIAADGSTVLATGDSGGAGANFQLIHTIDRATTRYIRVSANAGATGAYQLQSSFTASVCTLDIDGDGRLDQTDALLLIRHAFGFRGPALVAGISFEAEALRTEASIISNFIFTQTFDFDGNSVQLGATSDALLVSRIMRDLNQAPPVLNTIGASATRSDWSTQIRAYINSNCRTSLP